MLLVADRNVGFVLSGSGDVLEPEADAHGSATAIGSGGNYALAAARALAADGAGRRGNRSPLDEDRRRNLRLHQYESRARKPLMTDFSPREIVSELDRFIVGQKDAKRAVAIALRNRWRRLRLASPMREEVMPKNILMIGPTGCGKTEIARRLAKLAGAPFLKVEATKFTEVGYVGRDVEQIVRDLDGDRHLAGQAAQAPRHRGQGGTRRRGTRARRPGRRELLRRDPRDVPQETAGRRTRRQGDRNRAAARIERRADVRAPQHARRHGRRDQPLRSARQGVWAAHQAQTRHRLRRARTADRRRGGENARPGPGGARGDRRGREQRHRLSRRTRQDSARARVAAAPTSPARACSATSCR